MKSRKAIPNKGNNLLPMDIIEIFMSKNGAWEWFVYKKEESGRLYAIVFSPNTPDGEIGSVWNGELNEIGVIELTLEESMPPNGFHWDLPKTLTVVDVDENHITTSNMGMGEFHDFLKERLGE